MELEQLNPFVRAPDDAKRGMYIVFPLKYDAKCSLSEVDVAEEFASTCTLDEVTFHSDDFIQLMNDKCRQGGGFVRQLTLNFPNLKIEWAPDHFCESSDFQLFVFAKGIAFLTAFLAYDNCEFRLLYDFVVPGYVDDRDSQAAVRSVFTDLIESEILDKFTSDLRWFNQPLETGQPTDIIKEYYRMNIARVPRPFATRESYFKMAYNAHRLMDLNADFSDESESDVKYVSGAKDVNTYLYGWGCAVTSQELSFVYRLDSYDRDKKTGEILSKKTPEKLVAGLLNRAHDDLMLLMLVMYQKYKGTEINDAIHERYFQVVPMHEKHKKREKHEEQGNRPALEKQESIADLKSKALSLIAYDTLKPSQISRWNNVCEIYADLLDLCGVDDVINEVKTKIDLLTEAQDRIDAKRDNSLSMVITVFGLVSIVSAILEVVSFLVGGGIWMWSMFVTSFMGVFVLGMYLAKSVWSHKNRKGDL